VRKRLWAIHLVIVFACTFAFLLHEYGARGELRSAFLYQNVYPAVHRLYSFFTDIKFRVRGATPVRHPIVIVEIDSSSIETLGRWPWPRDYLAELIDRCFAAGANVVGLDIIFSESQQAIPEAVEAILEANRLGFIKKEFDFDGQLAETFSRHADHLALSWGSESICRPLFEDADACPVGNSTLSAAILPTWKKFAVRTGPHSVAVAKERTPVFSAPTLIANLEQFNTVARHVGFVNDFRDADGLVRRSSPVLLANGTPFPSLPLEMARMVLQDEVEVSFDAASRIESLRFVKSGRAIPVTPSGMMEIGFHGPGRTFPYVSAYDVLQAEPPTDREVASENPVKLLRGATVLIGISALALSDIAAMPFDPVMPGVEFHASVLDNLLSGDILLSSAQSPATVAILCCLMILGALIFSWGAQRMEAYPALCLFAISVTVALFVDQKILFANSRNWNTGFLYVEMAGIILTTIAAKYIEEEQRKKFLRAAFSKYVAPAVVDSLLVDPKKLALGGTRETLTILFSDIRGFTTLSEAMDAKKVAQFLNDYLGIMTDIVFAHGGTLDKYIGDAVMAFWGAPLSQPDHARRAAQAAVAMREAVAQHRARFQEQYGVQLNIGIGINTGIANVGNMGSERSFGYTVIGDSVNLASRLESATKFYGVGILVSKALLEGMARAGGSAPATRCLGWARVKGKGQATEIFHLLDEPTRPDGLHAFEEARHCFDRRDWDRAATLFTHANALLGGNDGPCAVYLACCMEFKVSPPQKDWDGSWLLS